MLKTIYDRLTRLLKLIDWFELVLTCCCMITIVAIGAMEIFSRYVLDKSLFFVYEVTVLLGNWMYFLGFCLVFKRKGDIEIEFFTRLFHKKKQRILSIITNFAVFCFLLNLSYYGFKLLIIQSDYATEGLGITDHYFSLPLFIGTISMSMISIKQILALLLNIEEA